MTLYYTVKPIHRLHLESRLRVDYLESNLRTSAASLHTKFVSVLPGPSFPLSGLFGSANALTVMEGFA